MKPGYKAMSLIALCALLFTLPGCAGGPEAAPSATSTPAAASAPAATPEPTVTPLRTPIATTEPEIDPTPMPTPKPTPKPTATPGDGRVTLAEGFYYVKLSDEIKERITGMSYPADDDDAGISYSDLRYVRVRYYDFEGEMHKNGELIVNKKLAREVMEIFYELYQEKYPFASIRLVDDYGQPGSDSLSMAANNTSAFCYRKVTGTTHLSRHSYGAAIDVNPMLNPYINGDRVSPKNSVPYLDRTLGLPGMIDHDDLCYQVFIDHGWKWGGDYRGDADYQHFYKVLD